MNIQHSYSNSMTYTSNSKICLDYVSSSCYCSLHERSSQSLCRTSQQLTSIFNNCKQDITQSVSVYGICFNQMKCLMNIWPGVTNFISDKLPFLSLSLSYKPTYTHTDLLIRPGLLMCQISLSLSLHYVRIDSLDKCAYIHWSTNFQHTRQQSATFCWIFVTTLMRFLCSSDYSVKLSLTF